MVLEVYNLNPNTEISNYAVLEPCKEKYTYSSFFFPGVHNNTSNVPVLTTKLLHTCFSVPHLKLHLNRPYFHQLQADTVLNFPERDGRTRRPHVKCASQSENSHVPLWYGETIRHGVGARCKFARRDSNG